MTTAASPARADTPALQLLPLARLRESPRNPRKHFDQAKLAELAESIRKSGIITPLIVRPVEKGQHFEIAAGHRRFRAAQLAGVDQATCVVRPMGDAEFLEVLTIENLQRLDVHPLEEAEGFQALMTEAGYDVARIAERVGRPHRYVYDRLRLLQLIPAAKDLFYAGRFTTAHAVILARLSAEDQARLVDVDGGALWDAERLLYHPDQAELPIEDEQKPMSVRELQAWVDGHVRFEPAAEDVPELFPETAAVLQAAESEEKVVKITHDHYIQPEARAEGERTYGPRSWKRADGKHGSKECDHSVIGVIAVGAGRGEAFRVCIDKKGCKVHWAAEQREAAKRAKELAGAGADSAAATRARQEAEHKERERRRQEFQQRWKKAVPKILEAIADAVKKAPLDVPRSILFSEIRPGYGMPKAAAELVPEGVTAADALRRAVFLVVASEAVSEWRADMFLQNPHVKKLGLDLKKILDEAAPAPKAETPAAAKKPAKKKTTTTRKG